MKTVFLGKDLKMNRKTFNNEKMEASTLSFELKFNSQPIIY